MHEEKQNKKHNNLVLGGTSHSYGLIFDPHIGLPSKCIVYETIFIKNPEKF